MPNNIVFNNVANQLQVVANGIVDGTNESKPLKVDSSGAIQISTVTVTAENLDIRELSGATDSVTVFGTVTVTAQNLDIRDLSGATDSVTVFGTVTVTAENLDIRDLSGVTDSVTVFGTVTVTAQNLDIRDLSGATDSVTVFGTVTVTAENLDIRNLSGATDSVQISSHLFTETNTSLSGVTNSSSIFVQNTSEQSMYSFYINNLGTNTLTVQLEISPINSNNYFVKDTSGPLALAGGEKTVLIAAKFLKYTRLFYDAGGATCTFDVYYNAQV